MRLGNFQEHARRRKVQAKKSSYIVDRSFGREEVSKYKSTGKFYSFFIRQNSTFIVRVIVLKPRRMTCLYLVNLNDYNFFVSLLS